ncbi:aldo/keto reductase [Microbacterium indicum]|uniref:aldo/keto reductase n=1 Tax=Microbacterium indicum TaxID=358100 RepID=UPI000409C298|nr:aldo/keto reductase [Microbacterium indicum]
MDIGFRASQGAEQDRRHDASHGIVAEGGAHPSAPLPEVGPPIGRGVRVDLGRSGARVFPLVLGTSAFGTAVDERTAVSVLDRYAQAGGNALHVSDDLGRASAEAVGSWIRSRGVARDVSVIARIGQSGGAAGLDPRGVLCAVDRLLRDLGTERIDVLVLDAGSGHAAHLEDVLQAGERLIAQGSVGVLGAAGFDATQLIDARVLASGGYPRIEVLDVAYGLGDRQTFDGELRMVAAPQGIAVLPTQSVPYGVLGRPEARRPRLFDRRTRAMRILDEVAAELGLPASAVAFAWVLAQPGVSAASVEATAPHQIDALARGVGVALTRAQLAKLDRAVAR